MTEKTEKTEEPDIFNEDFYGPIETPFGMTYRSQVRWALEYKLATDEEIAFMEPVNHRIDRKEIVDIRDFRHGKYPDDQHRIVKKVTLYIIDEEDESSE